MIREPIILDGDGGAQVFRTRAEAERYTEPIDILNGEYVAYDAAGMRLVLEPHGYGGVLSEPGEPDGRADEAATALRTLLRAIARARPVSYDAAGLDGLALAELVQLALEHDVP